MKNKPGPKSKFTPALGAEVCRLTRDGFRADAIAQAVGVSVRTLRDWEDEHAEYRRDRARARIESASSEEEEIRRVIADVEDGALASDVARVSLENRRWRCRVLDPARYGERSTVEHGVTADTAAALGAWLALHMPQRAPLNSSKTLDMPEEEP